MIRELVVDRAGDGSHIEVVGLVGLFAGVPMWAGRAGDVFARLIADVGEVAAAERLLDEGWSNGNGSLYLTDRDV